MIPFRSIVASQMVRAHQIQPELAAEHVATMDRKELLRRFKQYAGMRWAGLGLPLALALPESAGCPICFHVRRLVFDHNHATGEFRGEICNPCNSWLGLLELYPENYHTRTGRKEWRRWVYENAERIREQLERHTGITYAEAKRARITETELSAAGPKSNCGQRLFHPVVDAHDDDGRLSALYPFPVTSLSLPESGKEATGSGGRGGFLPRLLPESEIEQPGKSGSQFEAFGERVF